jgi:alkylation response protein AidB-like acyl-CoA dehydrogenase
MYAHQRKAFDKPIASLYAIQEKLAEMSMRIDASRLLTFKAAMLKDAGKPYAKDAAQAKLMASETATYASHQAIQVIKLLHKYFELLCSLLMPFGWVYVFYVGYIDKTMKPVSMLQS